MHCFKEDLNQVMHNQVQYLPSIKYGLMSNHDCNTESDENSIYLSKIDHPVFKFEGALKKLSIIKDKRILTLWFLVFGSGRLP